MALFYYNSSPSVTFFAIWAGLHAVDLYAMLIRAQRNRLFLWVTASGMLAILASIVMVMPKAAITWSRLSISMMLQFILLVGIILVIQLCSVFIRFAIEVDLRPGHLFLAILKPTLGLLAAGTIGAIAATFWFNARDIGTLIFAHGVLISLLGVEIGLYIIRAMIIGAVDWGANVDCPNCASLVSLRLMAHGLGECSKCGQSFIIKKHVMSDRFAVNGVVVSACQFVWDYARNLFWWLALRLFPIRWLATRG